MRAKGRGGFTLIELIIVVLVIGILAAIAVPKLFITRDRAYRNSMIADLRNLAASQEIYHLDQFSYSADLGDLGFSPSRGVTLSINEATNRGWGAVATHSGVAGRQCGIFYGSAAAASGSPATVPGVITCDFDI